jgi:O-antigen ligase
MWADYPILGVGPENFRFVRFAHYHLSDPVLDRLPYVCHSLYVQVLTELGTAGALATLGILTSFFVLSRSVQQRLKAKGAGPRCFERCLVSGLVMAMIGYLVSGAFVCVFWYPHIWVLSGLLMGLNSYVSRDENGRFADKPDVRGV